MQIDRNSHFPLYLQLKELLLNHIELGNWKPGQQLPTEEEIQRDYELSRTTVRQALRELELEGRIHRQPGRGTFVARPKVQEGTESFSLDVIDFREQGFELSWKVLSTNQMPAAEQVAVSLQIAPGSRVFGLRRLRIANGLVLGYVVSYVADGFLDKVDLSLTEIGGSMNYITGIDFSKCMVERIVEALPVGREEAKILEMTPGEPILVITRLLKNVDGRPIEYFRGCYRGDRFRYHVQSLPPQV